MLYAILCRHSKDGGNGVEVFDVVFQVRTVGFIHMGKSIALAGLKALTLHHKAQ